ncbi:YcaO-like family protein [Mesorhizobium sp. LHD-90]|uniref:YcaO-like family protein n=1 Tax=Mesorhizobium sp. LHD-90 TaxID=3071414 RepID=UPI0027DEBFEA|nr:YcaO-like family protein [Mesorhizobium sp. LHD-90]MDQ6434252.1 YcaO-like family protein [Mesorhizobium sp. LHD-90]
MRLEKRHWDVLANHPSIGCARELSRGIDPAVAAEIASAGFGGDLAASDFSSRRLFALAALRGMAVDVFQVPGGSLAASNIDLPGTDGPEKVTVSGKGFSTAPAVLGCLGEAAEVSSWMYRPTDREVLVGDVVLDRQAAVSAGDVLGFSAAQIRNRQDFNRFWDGWDAIAPARQIRKADLWTTVRDATGSKAARCPAFLCFGRFGEAVHGDKSMNVDSNGCAAGSSMDDARLRAILEIAERDATGIWWWRGCRRERIAPDRLDDAKLSSALAEHGEETGRRAWFLDISTFRNCRAVAAVSCGPNGERVALGFAAALCLRDAVRASFLEMIQTELAIDAYEIRREVDPDGPLAAGDSRMARWLRQANLGALDFVAGADGPPSKRPAGRTGTLSGLIGEMAEAGSDVWFADLSRAEIGVPVVKAISAGLAHFKPRWGCRRIWDLPQQRGWATKYGRRDWRKPPPLLV